MGGHMADPIWPLLLLGIVPGSLGLGVVGWREAPTMAYRTQLNPEGAWFDEPLPSLPSEPHHTTAWKEKKYVGLSHLPPLFNVFGVQLPPHSGPKQWVARNSGWSGLGEGGNDVEKRGGGERVERSVVQQVVPWNMMYFSPMLRG